MLLADFHAAKQQDGATGRHAEATRVRSGACGRFNPAVWADSKRGERKEENSKLTRTPTDMGDGRSARRWEIKAMGDQSKDGPLCTPRSVDTVSTEWEVKATPPTI